MTILELHIELLGASGEEAQELLELWGVQNPQLRLEDLINDPIKETKNEES